MSDLTEAVAFSWACQLLGTCLEIVSHNDILPAQIFLFLPLFFLNIKVQLV